MCHSHINERIIYHGLIQVLCLMGTGLIDNYGNFIVIDNQGQSITKVTIDAKCPCTSRVFLAGCFFSSIFKLPRGHEIILTLNEKQYH